MTTGPVVSEQQAILNGVLSNPAYTPPATWYIGLHNGSSPPARDGSGFVEVVGSGYARQSTTGSADWGAAAGSTPSVVTNSAAKSYPQTTSTTYGTPTHFGLFSAPTGGTPRWVGTISNPVAVPSGIIPQFAPGALKLELGNPADTF